MKESKGKILFIEDDKIDRMAFERFARGNNFPYQYNLASSVKEARGLLEKPDFQIVVTDFQLGDGDCFDLLADMKGLPFLVITGAGDEQVAIKAMKSGATDYIVKDPSGNYLNLLPISIENTLKRVRLEQELKRYRENLELLVKERTQKLEDEIEKRKWIEFELSLSEAKFQDLYDNAPDMFFSVDAGSGDILHCNKAASRITGYEINEIIAKKLSNFFYLEKNESSQMLHDLFASAQEIDSRELRLKKKDGSIIYVSLSSSSVMDKEGNTVYSRSTLRDIDRQKNIEIALAGAKLKAEESDRTKSTFLIMMSHEIRTPLNSIVGYTDLLLKEDLSQDHKENLLTIKRNGNMLLTIINDILDVSKIEDNIFEIINFNFSVHSLVKDLESIARLLIAKKRKSIEFSIHCDSAISAYLQGDSSRIKQVLNNLIHNAVKFTHQGKIEVGIKLKNDLELLFYVKDTGIGINEKKKEAIFEPFRQVDEGLSRKYGGLGLGLTISRKIVELMGGQLVHLLNSEDGRGSVFQFTIPYKKGYLKEDDNKSKITTDMITSEKYKILVAEDDPDSQMLLKKILEKMGHQVLIADNGKDALGHFSKENNINLILMDIQMPIMNGIESTKAIREKENKENLKKTPIIALSAAARKEDIDLGLLSGCDDYMIKPMDFSKLIETMGKYLR